MIEILLLYLPACFVVAYVASQKGRSGIVFFFLSLFLTPLLGILAAIAVPRIEGQPARRGNDFLLCPGCNRPRRVDSLRCPHCKAGWAQPPAQKKCPMCAEMIQPEARKCRYCGADQAEAEPPPAAAAPMVMGTCPGCRKLRGANVGRCVYCGNTEPVRLSAAS